LARLASDNRPVAWIRDVGNGGGRMFYTIKGHNKSVYEEPDFRKLVLNGILWATHRLEQ
jgi:type 1 glutamine amidotransferase